LGGIDKPRQSNRGAIMNRVTGKAPAKSGVGYKTFGFWRGRLYPAEVAEDIDRKDIRPYPVGRWIRKENWGVSGEDTLRAEEDGRQYLAGFHIFTSWEAALAWARGWCAWGDGEEVIRRVEYRGAHTVGAQAILDVYGGRIEYEVIVADEMKILRRRPGENIRGME